MRSITIQNKKKEKMLKVVWKGNWLIVIVFQKEYFEYN